MNSRSGILFGALAVVFLFSSSVLCSGPLGNLGGTDNLSWKVGNEDNLVIASFKDIDVVSYNAYTAPPGKSMTANLPNLESVRLESGQKILGDYAFAGCSKLKDIYMPQVEIIGYYAFAGTGFDSITIPRSVKVICERAFAYCDNLKDVYMPYGICVSPDAFECSSPTIHYY